MTGSPEHLLSFLLFCLPEALMPDLSSCPIETGDKTQLTMEMATVAATASVHGHVTHKHSLPPTTTLALSSLQPALPAPTFCFFLFLSSGH